MAGNSDVVVQFPDVQDVGGETHQLAVAVPVQTPFVDVAIRLAHLHDLGRQAIDNGFCTHNEVWTGALGIARVDAIAAVHLCKRVVVAGLFIRATCGRSFKIKFPIKPICTSPVGIRQQKFCVETDVRTGRRDLVNLHSQDVYTVVDVQCHGVFIEVGFIASDNLAQR